LIRHPIQFPLQSILVPIIHFLGVQLCPTISVLVSCNIPLNSALNHYKCWVPIYFTYHLLHCGTSYNLWLNHIHNTIDTFKVLSSFSVVPNQCRVLMLNWQNKVINLHNEDQWVFHSIYFWKERISQIRLLILSSKRSFFPKLLKRRKLIILWCKGIDWLMFQIDYFYHNLWELSIILLLMTI